MLLRRYCLGPTAAVIYRPIQCLRRSATTTTSSPVHELADRQPALTPEQIQQFNEAYAEYQRSKQGPATENEKSKRIRRSGVVALKIGMMGMFDAFGERHPVTLLQVDSCHVVQAKTQPNSKGLVGLQVGAGEKKVKNCTKAYIGHHAKVDLPPKRVLFEFPVSPDATIPAGTQLTASHFVAGQLVDIQGTTNGKGFAGAMKRWGFKGQSASHGVSISHRSLGSTGNCQDPGRVWKGKKMAGRMGCDTRTVQNMKILRIDPVNNILYIRGSVPGRRGNWVRVTDAIRAPDQVANLPFPTATEPCADSDVFAPVDFAKDPFKNE